MYLFTCDDVIIFLLIIEIHVILKIMLIYNIINFMQRVCAIKDSTRNSIYIFVLHNIFIKLKIECYLSFVTNCKLLFVS